MQIAMSQASNMNINDFGCHFPFSLANCDVMLRVYLKAYHYVTKGKVLFRDIKILKVFSVG